MDISDLDELIGYEILEVQIIEKLSNDLVILESGDLYEVDAAEICLNELDNVAICRAKGVNEGGYMMITEDGVKDAVLVRKRRS